MREVRLYIHLLKVIVHSPSLYRYLYPNVCGVMLFTTKLIVVLIIVHILSSAVGHSYLFPEECKSMGLSYPS